MTSEDTATVGQSQCSPPNLASMNSLSTVASEGVYAFLNGLGLGAVWGLVTPFHPPGTSAATIQSSKDGFLRPFSSLSAVGHNAAVFGAIFAVQRLTSKWVELLRGRDDLWNQAFGFGAVGAYYHYVLSHSDKRLIAHNRAVGGALALSVFYGVSLEFINEASRQDNGRR